MVVEAVVTATHTRTSAQIEAVRKEFATLSSVESVIADLPVAFPMAVVAAVVVAAVEAAVSATPFNVVRHVLPATHSSFVCAD